jgi:hypothetical protein
MKSLLVALILLAAAIGCAAQQDSIVATKVFGGYKFTQDGTLLTVKSMLTIMESDQKALDEMKLAKSNADVASVFSYAGGFLIGWPLGTAIAGGDPNWVLAGVGLGCIAIGIPLSIKASKHAFKAAELYNTNHSFQTSRRCVDVQLGMCPEGAGFIFSLR